MNAIARRAVAAFLLCCSVTGHALDKVTFLTNWYAEAEHGGFYQAVAEGIYEKYGLDVKIGMGGRRSTSTSCCSPKRRIS